MFNRNRVAEMANKDWETLIVDQIPGLRRYARALCLEQDGADELVQDCLERAWSRFHTWKPDSNLRAWLFTIMHNLFLNSIRRQNNGPGFVSFEDRDISAHHHDPLALRDLENGLARLAPQQRELIALAGLEQMPYSEISKILDIPVGTVMSRLSRSREKLRQFMSIEPTPTIKKVK